MRSASPPLHPLRGCIHRPSRPSRPLPTECRGVGCSIYSPSLYCLSSHPLCLSLSRVLSKSISRRLHTALYLHGRVGADVSRLRSVRKGGDCKETLRPIGEPTVRGSYSLSGGGSGISPSARLCEVSFAVEDFFLQFWHRLTPVASHVVHITSPYQAGPQAHAHTRTQ